MPTASSASRFKTHRQSPSFDLSESGHTGAQADREVVNAEAQRWRMLLMAWVLYACVLWRTVCTWQLQ